MFHQPDSQQITVSLSLLWLRQHGLTWFSTFICDSSTPIISDQNHKLSEQAYFRPFQDGHQCKIVMRLWGVIFSWQNHDAVQCNSPKVGSPGWTKQYVCPLAAVSPLWFCWRIPRMLTLRDLSDKKCKRQRGQRCVSRLWISSWETATPYLGIKVLHPWIIWSKCVGIYTGKALSVFRGWGLPFDTGTYQCRITEGVSVNRPLSKWHFYSQLVSMCLCNEYGGNYLAQGFYLII